LLDGKGARVNWWGFSYGTTIGQQMLQMLPPHRLGRIMLDGVVSLPVWSSYADTGYLHKGFNDNDGVLRDFARRCLASADCPLASDFKSVSALMDRMDREIDHLYFHPQPVYNASYPAVMTASSLRSFLFLQLYSTARWPAMASVLKATFAGDYAPLAEAINISIEPRTGFKVDLMVVARLELTAFADD
jgi:pimeloyl-ACP methyl ester carboxylesterase